jgi:hypothetical protein
MSRGLPVVALAVAFVVGLAACKSEPRSEPVKKDEAEQKVATVTPLPKEPARAPEAKKADEAFYLPVVESIKKAGFAVSDFESQAAKPYKAQACARGEIEKFDAMICLYESEEKAKAAEADLSQFVEGAVTGASRRSGLYMLTIADRKKTDLGGKTLNKVLAAFTKSGSGS